VDFVRTFVWLSGWENHVQNGVCAAYVHLNVLINLI